MRRLRSLLLLVALSASGPARAQEPARPGCSDSNKHWRTEHRLLNVQLGERLVTNLRSWDTALSEWRATAGGGPLAALAPGELIVLHLWAHYCEPCKREFPLLRSILGRLEGRARRRVHTVFLAEDTEVDAMRRLFGQDPELLRDLPLFQDTGGAIRRALTNELGAQPPVPITLLLDSDLTVRQAIVGSVESRGEELYGALLHLMSLRTRTYARGKHARSM